MVSFDLRSQRGNVPVRLARADAGWLAAQTAEYLGEKRPKLLLLTDENVALFHLEGVQAALVECGFEITPVVIPAGEDQKNWRRVKELLDILTQNRFARDDMILALGGGVITDLGGFVASIYLRGIAWIAAPTSLLGMVDAAIGGKTGINHETAKNLIGAFHEPRMVLAELSMLDTLPRRELRGGAAEIVKGALIAGGEFWSEIEQAGPDALKWSDEQLDRFIALGAKAKIDIVSRDEFEQGERVLLNLGHTLGHALEHATGYGAMSHGEAVFYGLRAMLRVSKGAMLMKPDWFAGLDSWLSSLPLPGAQCDVHGVLAATQGDKKTEARRLRWVLLREPGQAIVSKEVPVPLMREAAGWMANEVAHHPKFKIEPRPKRVLILNGPNLNLLGEREPAIYGDTTYEELKVRCEQWAGELGIDLMIRQSNIEGEFVNLLQWSRRWADGVILNPGAYTHTSVAIRDALAATELPAVEVHLSDPRVREAFRHQSLIADLCRKTVKGEGVEGYRTGMAALAEIFKETQ